MLYTDLNELKVVLEIDPLNTAEDGKLLFFIEQVAVKKSKQIQMVDATKKYEVGVAGAHA